MQEYEPRKFVESWLLLLLREEPTHGYHLAERLKELGIGDTDSSGIYRALRHLERKGLVHSAWYTSTSGPARRTYQVTSSGVAALHNHARALEITRDEVDTFLARYGHTNR